MYVERDGFVWRNKPEHGRDKWHAEFRFELWGASSPGEPAGRIVEFSCSADQIELIEK